MKRFSATWMTVSLGVLLVGSVVATGCGGLLGFEDFTDGRDGVDAAVNGEDAADAPVDAPRDSRTDADAEPVPTNSDAELAFIEPALVFPSTVTGTTSTVVAYTVTNVGAQTSGPLRVPLLTGVDVNQFAVVEPSGNDCTTATTLVTHATCTVRVRFAPTTAGTKTAGLAIDASPGGTVSATPITGLAMLPSALALSPGLNAFAATLIGNSAPTDGTFKVTNTGGSTTSALAIAITNASFTLVATTGDCAAGATLTAGATCTLHVRFTPSARGALTGALNVSATQGGATSATLTGTGQQQATLTTLNPGSSGSFGTVAVGHESSTVSWTIKNTGDLPTGTLSFPLGTMVGNGFYLVKQNCPAVLAAGASCVQPMEWGPSSPGAQSCRYQAIGSPGGTAFMDMTGTAQ